MVGPGGVLAIFAIGQFLNGQDRVEIDGRLHLGLLLFIVGRDNRHIADAVDAGGNGVVNQRLEGDGKDATHRQRPQIDTAFVQREGRASGFVGQGGNAAIVVKNGGVEDVGRVQRHIITQDDIVQRDTRRIADDNGVEQGVAGAGIAVIVAIGKEIGGFTHGKGCGGRRRRA